MVPLRSVRGMRSLSIILISCLLSLGPCSAAALADGGRVVLMERQGDLSNFRFHVARSSAGRPNRYQRADSGRRDGNAHYKRSSNRELTPSSGRGRTIHAVATNDTATNKLLSAALVDLPEPGLWDIEIDCLAEHGPARVQFMTDAGPRSARGVNVWPWFSWPACVVVVYGIHRRLISRRTAAG